jgi:hypothetical protein
VSFLLYDVDRQLALAQMLDNADMLFLDRGEITEQLADGRIGGALRC